MSFSKKITDTKIRIGEVRFSYTYVFAPRATLGGGDPKYSVVVLIPKTDKATIALVNEAIEAAKLNGKTTKWGGRIPANCKSPLHDGDIERPDDHAYAGCMYLNASSSNKPGVKVLEHGELMDALGAEDFYSGCYGAVTLNMFAYDTNGNRGIGVGLNNLIKTRDGERLAGGSTAEEDFSDLTSGALD